MAINNYFDNTDLNIYFHMKNHYKKLRSARSTIDNSRPQSFVKTFSTPPNSVRSLRGINLEERDIKNDQHLPIYSGIVRKHSCITTTSTSGTSINTINLPPRRKPSVTTFKMKYSPRSHSMDSTRRKSTGTKLKRTKNKNTIVDEKCNIGGHKSEPAVNKIGNLMADQQLTIAESNQNDTNTKDPEEKSNMQPRVEEHEYLQFLLRITEDIIINNLYTDEDIEKVFATHMEANKSHLKTEKMEAQLVRLCTELDIPYKNNKKDFRESECYEHFFHSHSSDHNQRLEGCECTTKRILDIDTKENKKWCKSERKEENNEFYFKKISTILANKCSLDRVTECTEPSNSVDAIIGSMKQLSTTGVQDSAHNILSCFMNVNGNSTETLCDSNIPLDTEETMCDGDDDLTEKEKLGCKDEEILFEKLNDNLINQIGDDNKEENLNTENDKSINEKVEQSASVENITNVIDQVKEKSVTHLNILDNDVNMLVEDLNIISPKNIKHYGHECLNSNEIENVNIVSPLPQKFDECQLKYSTNDILLIKDNIQNNEANFKVIGELLSYHHSDNTEQYNQASSFLPKYDENQIDSVNNIVAMKENIHNIKEITLSKELTDQTLAENAPKVPTNDQCTQMEVTHSDKECNTNIILSDHHKNDYVLLNGPVYVLKTVLNSEDKLIVYDKDNTVENVDKEIDTKLCNEKIEPVHYDTVPILEALPKLNYIPPYMQDDFSKLLSSDYDLMPQRDSDTSNKYHHLLVDATTSISNVNFKESLSNMFTNPNALLLGDKYELISQFQKEEHLVSETGNIEHSNLTRNGFQFRDKLCTGSQYDLKSTLLKEVNSCLNVTGTVNKLGTSSHEQVPDLDVPLTNYEQFSHDIKESDIINKDLSESGEIVRASICTDEDLSQISTFRSDNEISSNLSPTRNILGKRKLKHPL